MWSSPSVVDSRIDRKTDRTTGAPADEGWHNKRVTTKRVLAVLILWAAFPTEFRATGRVEYRFTFPELQHHWMQVEVIFNDLDPGPLELRMSRASPARYALHDLAQNVYDVHAFDDGGRAFRITRPDPHGWIVPSHSGRVVLNYKVYGDRMDGTYLGIDETHAHINMPAAVMWARGLDQLPVTLTFEPSVKAAWRIATRFHPGRTPYEFTAPNLQYLMDNRAELGPIVMRQFSFGAARFRFALHHAGTDGEVDGVIKDVKKIFRQQLAIFGELPQFEPPSYTFLIDYLRHAAPNGMEHRNSTVIASASMITSGRAGLLDSLAHEFFHSWNVERIRPASLEPFDFERANLSGELWLTDGFTKYYGRLALKRAGLVDVASAIATFTTLVDTVTTRPGRLVRTAEEMSWMAAFSDGGDPVDRTNWATTVISYYPLGGAIVLALDLTLRERSDGRVTLDHFVRAMWRKYGRPGGRHEGYVDHPYTIVNARATLAEVSVDQTFAHDFFARYIQGHDVADYGRLLGRAGFVVRKPGAGRAWLGDLAAEPDLRIA